MFCCVFWGWFVGVDEKLFICREKCSFGKRRGWFGPFFSADFEEEAVKS